MACLLCPGLFGVGGRNRPLPELPWAESSRLGSQTPSVPSPAARLSRGWEGRRVPPAPAPSPPCPATCIPRTDSSRWWGAGATSGPWCEVFQPFSYADPRSCRRPPPRLPVLLQVKPPGPAAATRGPQPAWGRPRAVAPSAPPCSSGSPRPRPPTCSTRVPRSVPAPLPPAA